MRPDEVQTEERPVDGDRPGPESTELRLGEWLVNRQLVSRGQLFDALNVAYRDRCRLGDALVRLGLLSRSDLEREVGWLGASLYRRPEAPPPPPPAALRQPRATPPPLPARAGRPRLRRATPPPLPADARPRSVTPRPLPAAPTLPRRTTPDPDPAGLVYLLTRRKS